MSGSAGGNRITRADVAKTTDNYINRILKKFPAFKSAKISGSYNTSAKEDFGDIDLIVNLEATDKKNIKVELAKFLSSLPDDVIVPFKSEKYKGKKYLNTGEIVTILYPIEGQPDQYVQIDNIVSVSDDEAEFKKEFLDYPAEIQGLLLGLAKVICLEEDPKSIFARMGIKNVPELEANQEYEFNLSSAGLTLRIVTLDNFKEIDRTEVWKTSNWSNIKKLFTNYKIDGSFEELLNDISSKVQNPRSKNRIKGVFNSMVSIKSGEVGTPKGNNKQKSLDKVNSMLSETNLGRYIASLLLEQDNTTIALFPGKFKPPHKGHFSVVKQLLNKADQVVVLVSPKTHDGISADEAVAAWELYKDQLVDGDKVEIRVSAITPVKDVYDFIENNPEITVYAAYGKGEEDRYKNLGKYPNAKIFDAGNFGGLNATDLRKAIRDGNEEEIKKFLPDGVEIADFLLAMGKKAKEEPKPEPAPAAEQPPAEQPPAEQPPTEPLKEYSDKLIKQLINKFQQEKPNLEVNIIQSYINRFAQIKDSPRVTEKDITKYNWKDLETTVDANQPKRIKAGKINDGEPSKDANLVYNQNGLRIYVGKTKNACIKYGNGYSFCISARGDDNLYHDYRFEQRGTPYFIFDDTKSSGQKEDGSFIDPTHLSVIFVYYDSDEHDGIGHYTITTADNPGEDHYSSFKYIENRYPRLKGLEKIFKPVEIDPKEKAEYDVHKKYNNHLSRINSLYDEGYGSNFRNKELYFNTIESANNRIDDILSGKIKPYKIIGELKNLKKEDKYITTYISQNRFIKTGSNIEDEYKKFAEDVLISLSSFEVTLEDIFNDWRITSEEVGILKEYLDEIKQLVDEYRNKLSKLKLMTEGLQRLTESETGTIGEFIKYACKNLAIQNPPRSLTLSYDTNQVKDRRSFGYFDPNDNKIWVYVKNRNMADILRTLAHELVHHKQNLDGRISYESGKTGSEIENEANAKAGILLRDFGKQNDEIYQ
jgi:cytidyltransferase-like protein